MDLSTLSIRELFAELTTVEDALHGRTEEELSASRRRVLEQRQELLCQELRSRPLPNTSHAPPPQDPGPVPSTSARSYEHEGHTFLAQQLGSSTGPQFVLVHGIGVASTYFNRLAPILAGSAGVHVLELPGFGGAPKPAAPLSVAELAAVVNSYVTTVDLDRPVLVGHSMGSQVVVEAALQAQDRVLTVVVLGSVVDPQARSAPQQGLRLLRSLVLESPSTNLAVLRDYARTGPRWYLATVPHMLAYRTEDAVRHLRVPLLIVRGSRDPISTREWNEQLRRLALVARFVEVPGAAHVVMHTHPTQVAGHILAHTAAVAVADPKP